jgi:hypothetical protein
LLLAMLPKNSNPFIWEARNLYALISASARKIAKKIKAKIVFRFGGVSAHYK